MNVGTRTDSSGLCTLLIKNEDPHLSHGSISIVEYPHSGSCDGSMSFRTAPPIRPKRVILSSSGNQLDLKGFEGHKPISSGYLDPGVKFHHAMAR